MKRRFFLFLFFFFFFFNVRFLKRRCDVAPLFFLLVTRATLPDEGKHIELSAQFTTVRKHRSEGPRVGGGKREGRGWVVGQGSRAVGRQGGRCWVGRLGVWSGWAEVRKCGRAVGRQSRCWVGRLGVWSGRAVVR